MKTRKRFEAKERKKSLFTHDFNLKLKRSSTDWFVPGRFNNKFIDKELDCFILQPQVDELH